MKEFVFIKRRFYLWMLLLSLYLLGGGSTAIAQDVEEYKVSEANKKISTQSSKKFQRRIDSLRLIFNNTELPYRTRINAQMRIVLKSLYKDTRNSLPEVQKYIEISTEYADSSSSLAHAYECMGFYYQKMGEYRSARYFYERKLAFASKNGYQGYYLSARIDLAVLEEKMGNYGKALDAYQEIIPLADSLGKRGPEARARMNAGMLLLLQSDYLLALQHLQKALQLCKEANLDGYMASNNLYLGNLYNAIEEYPTAKNYYIKALRWSDNLNNSATKRLALIQYIRFKKTKGALEEALELSRALVAFEKELAIPNQEAEALYLLADVFHANGMLDSAEYYIQQALDIYRPLQFPEKLYKAYGIAGQIQLQKKAYVKAERFCQKSYELTQSKKDFAQQKDNCFCLYQVYKQKKAFAKALHYHEKFLSFTDKLHDLEKSKSIVKGQLQEKFKYQSYLDSLQNQQQIAALEATHQQKVRQKNRLTSSLAIGIALVLIIALVLGYAFRYNKKQKEKLAELNQLNKQIFSIIAHDFKGPLMALNYLVETLENTPMDEARMQMYLLDIKNQINQTSNVLDTLLNWAKSELQIKLNQKFETDLSLIVEEMQVAFAKKIEEKNIDLHRQFSSPSLVNIHPDLARIVVRNLLSNAIKYSQVGSNIWISFDAQKRILQIRDEGMGMDKEKAQQLFEAPVFSQIGTQQESGFGIGLYITYGLVKKIGGDIQFSTEIDKGTSFFVYLPA